MQLKGKIVKAKAATFEKDGKTVEWFDCLFLTTEGNLVKVTPVKEIRDEAIAKEGVTVTANIRLSSDEKFYPKIYILSFE